ncbi:glycosyltransferase family 2 protein [Pedobacter metabolipauper]|uniref:Cellulose synthase/poly-beta-1,6-N-acetylglucosamine synthase-like glycosyltransferase n=1 Tax=Pedobacter metabolipauper TaxID=425513 RepID=A0A4R6SQZ6_9SPHI|nr:glycosyltransferase [Pedobacter metabolipauper]TDQ06668.1 cellulose synthase/poly-beta-1,6-N-acetylglucosamine synthase-like glycosyltransferase [Pedobacter metabolipauper]
MEILSAISYISLFLGVFYILVIIAFIRGWYRLSDYTPALSSKQVRTKVSVIVAARNEEMNIAKTLDDLVAQNYDKNLLEIIFIDDHSTDRTSEIISSYADRGVKLITLNESKPLNSYKKKAIQIAIAQSEGDLIVTTDADCRMGANWLKMIVSFYEEKKYKMISSPVAYHQEQGFFERAQSLEFLYLIGLGASTIGNDKPSTCNGANLAYEKAAFYEVGGFKGIDDLASGDDELLLHKMAAKYTGRIGFLKNDAAVVYTHAKATLADFIQQRKRWASKSTSYKNKAIIVLGVCIWLFNVDIFVNLISGIFVGYYFKVAIVQLLIKMFFEFLFLYDVTKFAKRQSLLVLFPAVSLLHIVYIVYIGIAGNSGKYNWKGRMVK